MLPTTSQKVQRGHPDRVVGLRKTHLDGWQLNALPEVALSQLILVLLSRLQSE